MSGVMRAPATVRAVREGRTVSAVPSEGQDGLGRSRIIAGGAAPDNVLVGANQQQSVSIDRVVLRIDADDIERDPEVLCRGD